MKYEGYFQFMGVAKPGKTPEQVEQAIYKEIEKLKSETVPDRELQKVKNEQTASNFRRLQSGFSLMEQLLMYDAYRGWRTINTDPPLLQAVTAADVQRIAAKYFAPENRSVLVLNRKMRRRGSPEASGQMRRLFLLRRFDRDRRGEPIRSSSIRGNCIFRPW